MSNETKIPASAYVGVAVVAGTAAFGLYQLGKLSFDWGKEGIRTLKEKKNSK